MSRDFPSGRLYVITPLFASATILGVTLSGLVVSNSSTPPARTEKSSSESCVVFVGLRNDISAATTTA
jgi:hypothetical protein